MTHLFHLKLFVNFEVILIKYFYISTEIFSCHYDLMNYIGTTPVTLYYFLSSSTKKDKGKPRKATWDIVVCYFYFTYTSSFFNIFKNRDESFVKSFQLSRQHSLLFFLISFHDKLNNCVSYFPSIYILPAAFHPQTIPILRERIRSNQPINECRDV